MPFSPRLHENTHSMSLPIPTNLVARGKKAVKEKLFIIARFGNDSKQRPLWIMVHIIPLMSLMWFRWPVDTEKQPTPVALPTEAHLKAWTKPGHSSMNRSKT